MPLVGCDAEYVLAIAACDPSGTTCGLSFRLARYRAPSASPLSLGGVRSSKSQNLDAALGMVFFGRDMTCHPVVLRVPR